jgi:L-amino acid N-acyltransferase YncA
MGIMKDIRLAVPSDAPGILEIYRPFIETTPVTFETEVPAVAQVEERIAAALQFAPWLVGTDARGIVGYAYATKYRERAAYQWCVEVSLYVREGDRRQGVGRSLYRSLFALLRLQGFRAANAVITLPNAASVGLHEALGFRPIGVHTLVGFKLGRWHDVGHWQLELGERRSEPAPILSVELLRRSPGFDAALRLAS